MKSRFATGHFFENLSLRKPFLVKNYNLVILSFRKNDFFARFLTLKTYKNIKKQPKYCLIKHALSIVLLNTFS